MPTNCLAACAHLPITVSEIEGDNGRKSSFFHTLLAFDALVRGEGVPSEYRHPLRHGKTRMVWLADMFIRFDMIHERDRQTDGRTDTACRHIPLFA